MSIQFILREGIHKEGVQKYVEESEGIEILRELFVEGGRKIEKVLTQEIQKLLEEEEMANIF
jgi:hypothetical protein